jgi:hypothetical protein
VATLIRVAHTVIPLPPGEFFSPQQGLCLQLSNLRADKIEAFLSRSPTARLDEIDVSIRTLLVEINIQGADRSENLISEANRSIRESRVAHLTVVRAGRKIRRVSNLVWYQRILGAVTGSSKAEVNVALAESREHAAKGKSSDKKFLTLYAEDAQISLRSLEVQSQLYLVGKLVASELRRERSMLYRISKFFKIVLGRGNSFLEIQSNLSFEGKITS